MYRPKTRMPAAATRSEHAHLVARRLPARREQRSEAGDEREDADADRERSGGPVPVDDDAVLERAGYGQPLDGLVAADGADEEDRAEEEHGGAEPVTGGPRGAPAPRLLARPRCEDGGDRERGREQQQLGADRRREDRCEDGRRPPAAAGANDERLRDEEEAEGRPGVRRRCPPGCRTSRPGRESHRRPRRRTARPAVRPRDGRGSTSGTRPRPSRRRHVLHRRIRLLGVVDEPERAVRNG